MTPGKFLDMIDRIEEIGNYTLPGLRSIAGEEPSDAKHWSRGKCIAEIIENEFFDFAEERREE